MSRHLLSLFLCAGLASTSWADGLGDDYKRLDESNGGTGLNAELIEQLQAEGQIPQSLDGSAPSILALQTCVNGRIMGANGLPCRNIDMQAFIPAATLGITRTANSGVRLNDVWGWTDPNSGREFALVGGNDRLVFVEITNPAAPIVVGSLPSRQVVNGQPMVSIWRGVKVFGNYAYVVADAQNRHGMQVFDLRRLLTAAPNTRFTANASLPFGQAHNIVMNEDTAFMYAVGTSRGSDADCNGGLLMIDVSSPLQPRKVGCYASDGYTHDAQCVVYRGPDTTHRGKEICVAYNEDTITIVDVTNKTTPVQLSRTPYTGSRFVHQGWFLNDLQRTILVNDELDEQAAGGRTRTYIFDVSDLDRPRQIGTYMGETTAVDHNLYTIKNPVGGRDIVIESNYRAGVRILNTVGIAQGRMQEAAFFDMVPGNDAAQFSGVWTTYAFFPSGNLVSTDLGNGLYVLRPNYAEINRLATTTPVTRACRGGEEQTALDGTICYESAD